MQQGANGTNVAMKQGANGTDVAKQQGANGNRRIEFTESVYTKTPIIIKYIQVQYTPIRPKEQLCVYSSDKIISIIDIETTSNLC